MADPQAPERKRHPESNLPQRSATEPPSLPRECLRQLGFFAVPEVTEKVWRGADWSLSSRCGRTQPSSRGGTGWIPEVPMKACAR